MSDEAPTWRKSSACTGNATCVEVTVSPTTGLVGVRDSGDLDAGTLWLTTADWRAFTDGVKAGQFDV
jgi:hypothetical protein